MASNELTIATTSFKNPTLNALTIQANSILTAFGIAKSKSQVDISKVFYTVSSSGAFKDDGFANAVDYITKTFGASKSNAYAYIQVGGALASGRIPAIDASGNEFNFTQLRAMVSTKDTKALAESVESGEITANDSASDIEDRVKVSKPRTEKAPKKYRFAFIGYVDGNPEVIELGTHTLDEFRANDNEIDAHGYTYYAEFKIEGQHNFLYVDSAGVPVALVKAYDIPKPEKK